MQKPSPICPVCAGKASSPTGESRGPYHLFLCHACDVVFSNPLRSASAEDYGGLYRDRNHIDLDRLSWHHGRFLRLPPPEAGATLLDVGCGTGKFLAAARTKGYRVTGVDFDADAVEAARRRGLDDVHAADVEAFAAGHPGRAFDVVSLFEVLEHVESPPAVLRRALALLKPGGRLFVSVPHRNRWPRYTGGWDWPPIHLTRWSAPAMENFLRAQGLDQVRVQTGGVLLQGILMDRFRLGIVTGLVRRATDAPSTAGQRSRRLLLASLLARVKTTALDVLAAPFNAALRLARVPGQRLVASAVKPAPCVENGHAP